ncbi:metal-dependent hydrolase [Piscirickettsia salmonis]|uniref:WLM domain protein n=1 Tax=Piscirickettsia salmonis TaxID=1238 RepID=A0A9Q6PUF9_PISSA|nr:SprT family zinc-dependent metalloprotease [Piscirickettsia salmonis]ALA25944.1 metal-dependent hydrolase [Piscirickettsia salmonis]APS43407.1 metal-dependent hydrolase [Piscirickettsia salmonis]APS46759.1 metal-dependent hydrolase [Piscirickettsia salmonis]APS50730.1 metal-dependent hydrolase [Piscirickettsia salmonis]APS53936.1 metal-dependent hydrolase [Piscirickettsia salmonis]
MINISAEIRTTTQEHGVFAYGEEIIHYEVIRKAAELNSDDTIINRKNPSKASRKVIIKVHPDQRVVATVPHDATSESIQNAMLKRARWIWQSIKEFASQHDYVLPREYVSGETQFYLGRRYVLKVLSQPNKVSTVKLLRGKLEVILHNKDANRSKQVKALIDQWYLHHANNVFHERLQEMLPKAAWVEGIPSFKIMAMKKQWGSCSTKGSLMLNPHLVKASKECIDYVILHELCHISEHNHSDKFWRLLTQVMPNWKEIKSKLDNMAELYLNE